MADAPVDPFAPQPKDGGIDRRSFVKTAVTAAAVAAVGASTAGLVVPLSTAGRLKIRRFPYIGAKRIGGPAPQGIPLIPLKINDKGQLEGVPKLQGAPVDHSLEWYKYCAHDAAPGLEEGFTDDNVLRFEFTPSKVAAAAGALGKPLWYAEKAPGDLVVAADFKNIGDGAPFRWRSEGQEGTNIITGIVIKIGASNVKGEDVKAFMAGDFIAFCSFCAHFCCVPGYQESSIPITKGAFDKIYCTCHDSIYDPRDMKEYTFPPNM